MDNHKKVLVLADIHTNSIGGLIHPNDDIQIPISSTISNQNTFYNHRRELWESFNKQVNSNGPYDIVVLLGELFDLPHKRNFKNCIFHSLTIEQLVQLTINVLKIIPLNKDSKFYGCLGSRFHSSTEDELFDIETVVYDKIMNMGYETVINFENNPIDLQVYDKIIRATHKMTGKSINNIIANLAKQAIGFGKSPDILVSGHSHIGETVEKQLGNNTYIHYKVPVYATLPVIGLVKLVLTK